MKILIVGGGGREHTLAWKIAKSPKVKKIFCAPGNAGIAQAAECVPIAADNIEALAAFAQKQSIDLTVIGPEVPLSAGIVDAFGKKGLRVFGPSKKAARIEASKSFAKKIMSKYGIPTAKGKTFTDYDKALKYVNTVPGPMVVKADGLAAGKGVVVCKTRKEAAAAVATMLKDKAFGPAGEKILIEDCLTGEEASFIAFTDGKHLLPLPTSQDHKTIYDNDTGPNTGGMGAYSPAPVVDAVMHEKIMQTVMIPMVAAMAAEGCPYKGVLYAGLMIDRDRVNVVEFNARFGDPETQPLLMRLKSDVVAIMEAVVDERLDQCAIDIDPRPAVCVVMASAGYPGAYKKGMPISGLESVRRMRDVMVFHAGTAGKNGDIVAVGGRVLGVTALGDTVAKAIERAYRAVSKISWDGAYNRTDIGKKALKRLETRPLVGIVMGSESDYGVMKQAVDMLKKFNVPYEITVASAHRTPKRAVDFVVTAEKKGVKVIIAGAGHAAHLAGALAGHTILPVIGVPIDSSSLNGMDALLSTVQMPPGVPVATMAIGKSGAKNAGIFAVQILSAADPDLVRQLRDYKKEMADDVEKKARTLNI
ncbi:MAG: 5-(carboxyamino)imidazole ribonucleotide mutase [Desulfobacterales bacterium CG23_combo_of_CG06-09_8_20_14_all_51_8]|nr:MAG: 5-(carboxyamino)imidazole ribonucleotide mutase [Desulfobacterales bacterium CG23_combo_of_CG06-09_8_20_14_all_51_8]